LQLAQTALLIRTQTRWSTRPQLFNNEWVRWCHWRRRRSAGSETWRLRRRPQLDSSARHQRRLH